MHLVNNASVNNVNQSFALLRIFVSVGILSIPEIFATVCQLMTLERILKTQLHKKSLSLVFKAI